MKVCISCGETKNDEEFYKIKTKNGYRLHSYCKGCKSKVDKKWRQTHKYELKTYRETYKQRRASDGANKHF